MTDSCNDDNDRSSGWPNIQIWAALGVFTAMVALAVFAALCGRAFFADGSYLVVKLLENPHHFQIGAEPRAYSYYIIQAPVLLAQKFGLSSAVGYSLVVSLGLYIIPIVLYAISAYIVRRSPPYVLIVILTSIFITYSVNYINTELNILAPIIVLCAAVLSSPSVTSPQNSSPRSTVTMIVFACAAMLSIRLYEGILFSAPVLAYWSYKQLRMTSNSQDIVVLTLSVIAFLIAIVIAFFSWLAPRDPGNEAAFATAFEGFFRGPQLYLLICTVTTFFAILVRGRTLLVALSALSFITAILFVYEILKLNDFYAYSVYYINRAFVSLALGVIITAWFVFAKMHGGCNLNGIARARWLILLFPILAVVASDMTGTFRWNAYTNAFCNLLASETSTPKTSAALAHRGLVTAWSWTNPSLSVLLRYPGSAAVILNDPRPGWQPQIRSEVGFPGWRSGLCAAPHQ